MQQQTATNRWFRITLLVGSIVMLAWMMLPRPGLTQDGDGDNPFPHHAGLVVRMEDGEVHTACVDLGEDGEASGLEVLSMAAQQGDIPPVLLEYDDEHGAAICKVGVDGCDPARNADGECFCQCTLEFGEPCKYWLYWHLVNNEWEYSQQGTSSATVRAGEVEGWAWGQGSTDGGEGNGYGQQPPVIPFDEICVADTQRTIYLPLVGNF